MHSNQNIIASFIGVPSGACQPVFGALNFKDMQKIKGYNDYLISKNGKVYSTKNGMLKEMSQYVDSLGYLSLRLCEHAKTKLHRIHRLLADTFIDNPNDYPCINHKDGNKMNNELSNLEWCSYSQNNQHAFDNGLKVATNRKLNPLQVSIIRHSFDDMNDYQIAKYMPISRRVINDIRSGKTWANHKFSDR